MITLVIPCLNEEDVIPALFERVGKAADGWGDDYEVIVVDDGSTDRTWELLSEQHRKNARWKAIRLARNFGHQLAITAGMAQAHGDAVVVMDADLQDQPEEIQRFIEKWKEGYEVVYAVRKGRKEGLLKRLCYKLFYRILGRLSDENIPRDSGDFCLMDRKVLDQLNAMPECDRFVRGLRAWAGFRQVGVEYERAARAAGTVKYGFRKLARLAFSGLFSFSTVPLQIATWLGAVLTVSMVPCLLLGVVQRFGGTSLGISRGTLVVFVVLLVSGVQLLCIGIVGSYVGRIYAEVKRRPLWVEREKLGF